VIPRVRVVRAKQELTKQAVSYLGDLGLCRGRIGLLLASFFLTTNAMEGGTPCSSQAMGMNFRVMLHIRASFLSSPWSPSPAK
jgi:hypothetical protein